MMKELIQVGFRLSGSRDRRLTQGLVWAVAEGVLAAAPYPLLYVLMREVIAGEATGTGIAVTALAMVACVVLRIVAGRCGMPLVFAGTYALMGEARLRVADHLRRLPMGWFGRQRGGDIGARLTSDLELIEHIWSHFLGVFTSGLVMPVFLALFLFWLDWRLAVVLVVGVPLAIAVLAQTQRALMRPSARLIAANAAAQASLLEYVQGIAMIRGFGRFGTAFERLHAVLDEQHRAMLAAEVKPAPWLVAFGLTLELGYVALLMAGAWWISQGQLEPLVLVCFLVLALPIYRQLFDVGLAVMLLRFAGRALERIEALLAEPLLDEPPTPLTPQGMDIVFDNVRFAYEAGGRPALDGVSCTIASQALTAVVGPSGAGKSTLVHLIARLWDVDAGAIRIGGVDLRDIGTEGLHRHIAMVFQDVVLFAGTVLDNLRIGRPEATLAEAMQAASRARAHDFIMALPQGYDTVLDEGGASLSGGERQRISIARALLKNAPVVLLDEATSSVDPSAEAQLQQAITELARGRTVIVIAHRLHSVRHADHILVLDGGRLAEQGRHADLVARGGLYARLWQAQQQPRDWMLNRVEKKGL